MRIRTTCCAVTAAYTPSYVSVSYPHQSVWGPGGVFRLTGIYPLLSGTFISVIAFSGSRLSQRCRWSCQQRGLGLLRLVGLTVLCNLAERGLSERELELGEPGEQHQPRGRLPCALCPRLIAVRSDAIRFFGFVLGGI